MKPVVHMVPKIVIMVVEVLANVVKPVQIMAEQQLVPVKALLTSAPTDILPPVKIVAEIPNMYVKLLPTV